MNNQEAADVFAVKLKTTKKTNESKTYKAKRHEEIVSLQIRESNFKTTNLCEEERKHTEVKPATLKSILRSRKNIAPGPEGINFQLIKTTTFRNNRKFSANNSNIKTIRSCTGPMEN